MTERLGAQLKAMRRPFGGFVMSTAISAVAGVVSLPVLIAGLGARDWSSIAVAQSVGAVGAILIGLGWAVTGPTEIAQLSPTGRATYFWNSLRVRGIAAVPVVIVCIVIELNRDPDAVGLAVVATAAALVGLGGQWFFFGTADARGLLLLDTVPRAAALMVGAASVLITNDLISFAVLQLSGALLPVLLLMMKVRALPGLASSRVAEGSEYVRARWTHQLASTITALSGSVYLTLPVALLAVSAPGAVAPFALADRLARVARLAISPMTQTLQGWVSAAGASDTPRRERAAFGVSASWGATVAICFAVGAALFASAFSGGEIEVTWTLALLIGATLVATSISQTTGTIGLVLRGRRFWLAASAVVGGVVALPLLMILPPRGGAEGAALAVLIAEVAVLAVQFIALSVGARNRRDD